MSNRVDHQRLNNQKRTIKRGADSRRALSDEAFEALAAMKFHTTEVLEETLRAFAEALQLLTPDFSSKADERSRAYVIEVMQGIQKIINSR